MSISNDKTVNNNHHTTIRTEVPILFTTWNRQTLTATLLHIEAKQINVNSDAKITITIQLDFTTCQHMLHNYFFHTLPGCFIANTDFTPGQWITATLLLQPGIAKTLLASSNDAETVLAALLSDQLPNNGTSPLLDESYWFLLEASQLVELPIALQSQVLLRQSIRTNWLTLLYATAINKHVITTNLSLLPQITQHLNAEQLNYEEMDDDLLRIAFESVKQQRWLLLLHVDQKNQTIETYSIFPQLISVAEQPTLALQLLQLQQQLESGSFELDQDGELRFRLALACPSNKVERTAFQTLLGSQMQVMKLLQQVVQMGK
ncbi:hypothetical protein ACFSTH_00030 [Paenibacillus yanchengensis]|uniref:Uncharacterized protein n=1 Tax=Paenibacillus yanchengensis TaxID=2035833 RepID=A0ABW4YFB3_9BACL